MDAAHTVLLRAITLSTMLVVASASASTALAGTAPSDRPLFLIAATGSPGGTYYEYGQALAKLLSRILNLRVITQATLGARRKHSADRGRQCATWICSNGHCLGSLEWLRRLGARPAVPENARPVPHVRDALPVCGAEECKYSFASRYVWQAYRGGTKDRHWSNLRLAIFVDVNIDATLSYGTWDDLAVQLERGEVEGLAVAGSIIFSGDLRARGKASNSVHLADIGRDQQTAGYVSRAHRH